MTLARIISWDFLTADCRFSGFLLKDNKMLNRFLYSVSQDPATNSETTKTEFLYIFFRTKASDKSRLRKVCWNGEHITHLHISDIVTFETDITDT